jgi:hypothetical protein
MLTLVVPCDTVIALGPLSEYPSLTLQSPLHVTHPFVKEAACCWLKGRILEFFSHCVGQMTYSN